MGYRCPCFDFPGKNSKDPYGVKAVQKDKGPNSRKLPAVPAGLGFELVTSPVLAVKSKQPQNQGIFLLNGLKII